MSNENERVQGNVSLCSVNGTSWSEVRVQERALYREEFKRELLNQEKVYNRIDE